MTKAWQDKDRRRALMLSILLHFLALFLFVFFYTRPQRVPLESFLVIEVGSPALSEEQTDAPAADAPAPQAAEPQVEAQQIGEPVEQTSLAAQAQAETEPSPEDLSETQAIPVPQASSAVAETQEQTASVSIPMPTPAVATQETEQAQVDVMPDISVSTTLPDIQEVEVVPDVVAQSIPIPAPSPSSSVSSARTISTSPSVQVETAQELSEPDVSVRVLVEQVVPTPTVEASVETASSVPQPNVSAAVTVVQVVPTPSVEASVSEARAVPSPAVQASVSQAQAVPSPNIQTSVAGSSTIPTPNTQVQISSAVTVVANPSAQVASRQVIPIPLPRTELAAVNPDETGTSTETIDTQTQAALTTAGQETNRESGGNADQSGQTTAAANASPDNLGLAAGPEGSETPTGSTFANIPYRETRDRPLTVMLDNLQGYPQAGLAEASQIIEMPVEGGITRLMTVYDRIDPARVGPVRSTREYFHEVSSTMGGIMVHDGGSPGALAAISRSTLPTINAYFSSTEVFSRGQGDAPYNLFSNGNTLRQEIARLRLNRSTIVSGNLYRPAEDAQDTNQLTISFTNAYSSGFRFINDLNLYRWVRNGEDANDANGEAVLVDAVLLANIDAVPVPGDTEGRLYIPMRGGTATLYLRGKTISGRWDLENGVKFTSSFGQIVDLKPFKTWVVYAPQTASFSRD